jgi:hypothetical protein
VAALFGTTTNTAFVFRPVELSVSRTNCLGLKKGKACRQLKRKSIGFVIRFFVIRFFVIRFRISFFVYLHKFTFLPYYCIIISILSILSLTMLISYKKHKLFLD